MSLATSPGAHGTARRPSRIVGDLIISAFDAHWLLHESTRSSSATGHAGGGRIHPDPPAAKIMVAAYLLPATGKSGRHGRRASRHNAYMIDYAAWDAIGFPRSAADAWSGSGFTLTEAARWKHFYDEKFEDIPPAEHEPALAEEFRSLGFTPDDAMVWFDAHGYGGSGAPPDIAAWRDQGFDPQSTLHWWAHWIGWTARAREAREWVSAGATAETATHWVWTVPDPGCTEANCR